jgi:hypothetical protein
MVFWKKGGLVAKNNELKNKIKKSIYDEASWFVLFCFVMMTSPKPWHSMLRTLLVSLESS